MKQKEPWWNRILISLLIVGLFVVSVLHLSRNLAGDLRTEAFGTMWETAIGEREHFRSVLESKYSILETAASLLPAAELASGTPEAAARQLDTVLGSGGFANVYYADESGLARAADDAVFDCADAPYYREAMAGARSAGYWPDGGLFVFAVPVRHGQTIPGALIGTVSEQSLRAPLQTQLFGGASRFLLVLPGGSIALDAAGACAYGTELLSLFDAGSVPAETERALLQQSGDAASGAFEAKAGGKPVYGVYTALGVMDGTLLHLVPADAINGAHTLIRDNVLAFGAEVVLIAGFLALLLVWREKRRSAMLRTERARLQQSEESYRLLNQLSEGVMFEGSHPDGTLRFNRSYADRFGRESFLTCIADLERDNPYIYEKDEAAYRTFASDLLRHEPASSAEFRLYDRKNEPRWYRIEYLTAFDPGHKPGRFVGKLTDIDAEKRTMQRLVTDAARDPLTKLLNRCSMSQQVDDYLEDGGKQGLHAFFMIDLDEFKQINDTYGHVEGDRLLCDVADRLRALFRTSDFICRMGGDEFCVFLCNINSVERIGIKAQGLIDAVTQLGRRYDTAPRISASVGVAIPGKDGTTFAQLYQNADIALYKAKQSGKNLYMFCGAAG